VEKERTIGKGIGEPWAEQYTGDVEVTEEEKEEDGASTRRQVHCNFSAVGSSDIVIRSSSSGGVTVA